MVTFAFREKPINFEEKKQAFTDILSVVIFDNGILPDLIINNYKKRRSVYSKIFSYQGKMETKKVRIFGIGTENSQATVSLAVVEAGDALNPKIIFGGNLSKSFKIAVRCQMDGCFWHSECKEKKHVYITFQAL